jgi:hypothetical protein
MYKTQKINKRQLYFSILMFGVLISFFDAHIEVLTGFKRLPFPEIFIVSVASFFALGKLIETHKTNRLNLIISALIILSLFSGLLINKNGIFASTAGTVWVYKSLIALYIGWSIGIEEVQKTKVLKLLFYLSLLSVLFTWLQFLYGPLNPFYFGRFNPFGFNLNSSGIIGFMDNPNKNGFILLLGFLYVNIFKVRHKYVLSFFFITSILFAQSRQVIILLVLVLLYYLISVKRNYTAVFSFAFLGSIIVFFFKDTFFSRFDEISRILDTSNYFRLKVLKIGTDVFANNIFFGTGPGSFGGIVAHLTESPVHEEYKLFEHWKYYKKLYKVPVTIDMYWPHLIVELGLISTVLNIYVYRYIYKKIKKVEHNSTVLLKMLFFIVLFMGFFSMALEASYVSIPLFMLIGIDLKLLKIKNESSPKQT